MDGLKLSRVLARYYNKLENSNTPISTHETLLTFEKEMMSRAGGKVLKSREAAAFLHSEVVLEEGDVTRGGVFNMTKSKKAKVEEAEEK